MILNIYYVLLTIESLQLQLINIRGLYIEEPNIALINSAYDCLSANSYQLKNVICLHSTVNEVVK